MLSVPTSTAPALSRRFTSVASAAAGGLSRLILEPASVVRPATSNRFLAANGTPASTPSRRPAARSASIVRARAIARSPVTAVKALSVLSRSAMRRKVASTTRAAPTLPVATASAISAADAVACMASGMASGLEHRGRLGLVGQLELPHHVCQAKCDGQVDLDRWLPLWLDRQSKHCSARFDQCIECVFLHVAPLTLDGAIRRRVDLWSTGDDNDSAPAWSLRNLSLSAGTT